MDLNLPWPHDDTGTYRNARFEYVDFSGSAFRESRISGVTMRGVEVSDVDIDGFVHNLVVNGVSVMPLVEAELDRLHPVRVLLRSDDPAELRRGWAELLAAWDATIERARALPEPRRQERVDGEWSVAETLRHLVFATDAWYGRAVKGEAAPYHPLGLPPEFMGEIAEMGIDLEAAPTFDQAVELWRERAAFVSGYLATVSADVLTRQCDPPEAPGWPPVTTEYTHVRCLKVILDETWAHHRFAERDLAILERSDAADS